MKITFLLPVALFLYANSVFSQDLSESEKKALTAQEVVFYGFDFSNFKLANAKKIGDDLHKFLGGWELYCLSEISPKTLTRYLRKDSLILNLGKAHSVNERVEPTEIAVALRHSISQETVGEIISKYGGPDEQGIGFIIIMECFEKYTYTTSGYFVFFDIATKKILMSDRASTIEVGRYGMTHYWGTGMVFLIKNYIDEIYLKKMARLKKERKRKAKLERKRNN